MNKSPKVMIVEDDKFVSKAISLKFKDEGFEARTFGLAAEAMMALEKWTPDIVILDLLLPGIDGYTFLKNFRDDPKRQNIPVIIASNLENEGGLEVNDYIVKSELDLDDLILRARKLIVKKTK